MWPRWSHHLRRDQNGWKFGQRPVLWSPDRFCGPSSRMWASVLQRRRWHMMAQARQVKLKCTGNFYGDHTARLCFELQSFRSKLHPSMSFLHVSVWSEGRLKILAACYLQMTATARLYQIVLVNSRCFFLGANCFQSCLSASDISWRAV